MLRLSLIIGLTLGQTEVEVEPCGPEGPIICSTSALAFFEFAPSSGTGMGTACACTTPTGAKGETLTFARASSGTCLKGATTSGIANGDMVTCSTNQPAIMPGGDGTGQLGLLGEVARTNALLRSQEIDNVAFTKDSAGGAAAPTVTADQAVAPDGTTTAERVQFAATSSTQASRIEQVGCTISSTDSGSVWVKGNGTSGTLDFGIYTGSAWSCGTCSFVASTWTHCLREGIVVAGGSAGHWTLGNASAAALCNNAGRSAADVFVWGTQCEVGAYASSYIATTTAAVARAVIAASFPAVPSVASAGSSAATVVPLFAAADVLNHPVLISTLASGRYMYAWQAGAVRAFDGTNSAVHSVTYTAGVPKRIWSSWTGATLIAGSTTDGTSTSGTFDGTMDVSAFKIATSDTAAEALDGVIKGVCLDPSPSRCR